MQPAGLQWHGEDQAQPGQVFGQCPCLGIRVELDLVILVRGYAGHAWGLPGTCSSFLPDAAAAELRCMYCGAAALYRLQDGSLWLKKKAAQRLTGWSGNGTILADVGKVSVLHGHPPPF